MPAPFFSFVPATTIFVALPIALSSQNFVKYLLNNKNRNVKRQTTTVQKKIRLKFGGR
jgi:hypothetical protein